MAESAGEDLRDDAGLLGAVYIQLGIDGELPLDKWALRQTAFIKGGSVQNADHRILTALAELYPGSLPSRDNEADYLRAHRTVRARLGDAAAKTSREILDGQIQALADLRRKLKREDIPAQIHNIAADVRTRLDGFIASAEDEKQATVLYGHRIPPSSLPDSSNPRFASGLKEVFEKRVKAALAAEFGHYTKLVPADRPRPTAAGGAGTDGRARRKEVIDLCKILSIHPRFVDIFSAYARSPDAGTGLADGLVAEATAATAEFKKDLAASPEDVWRYPPLIVLGVKKLGLQDIAGFAEYAVDLGQVIGQPWYREPLTILGYAIALLGVVLTGPVAEGGGLALSALVFGGSLADLATTGGAAALTYLEEREQDLAAVSGSFSTWHIAKRSDYSATKLAAGAALLSAIAFVFSGVKLFKAWRARKAGTLRGPGGPPAARLRTPANSRGTTYKALNRGTERARFADRQRRPLVGTKWARPGETGAERQRILMASGTGESRPPPTRKVDGNGIPPAARSAEEAYSATGKPPSAARATSAPQKAVPPPTLPPAIQDRLPKLGTWRQSGKVNINEGGFEFKNTPAPAHKLGWEQFETGFNRNIESFAEEISDKPVRKSIAGQRGWSTPSSVDSNELKLQKQLRGRIGEGAQFVRTPDATMEVVAKIGRQRATVSEAHFFEATLQQDFEAEIGFAGGKQRQVSGTTWLSAKLPRRRYSDNTKLFYSIFCPEGPTQRTIDFLNNVIAENPGLEVNWFVVK